MYKIPKIFLAIVITLFAVASLNADTLVLKNGKKYYGTITRSTPGKIAIRTRVAKMEFTDDKVSFRLTKMTPPKDAEKAFKLIKEKIRRRSSTFQKMVE